MIGGLGGRVDVDLSVRAHGHMVPYSLIVLRTGEILPLHALDEENLLDAVHECILQ